MIGNRQPSCDFLAHVQVPSEGPWTIPAMRPINAIWTGGTTTVVLDDFHVLQQCREKAGSTHLPRAGRLRLGQSTWNSSRNRLEPVAELVFRKPGADSSCQVRGQLFIGGSPSRLECQLNWTLHHGSLAELRDRPQSGLAPRPGPDSRSGRSLGLASVRAAFRRHEASRGAAGGQLCRKKSWYS